MYNLVCIDGIGLYMCVCNFGFIGKFCEVDIDDCIVELCKN